MVAIESKCPFHLVTMIGSILKDYYLFWRSRKESGAYLLYVKRGNSRMMLPLVGDRSLLSAIIKIIWEDINWVNFMGSW